MQTRTTILLILFGLLGFLAYSSTFTIRESERAVLLRFGAIQRADLAPGLHFKVPFIEDVKIVDGRVLTLDSTPERYLTLEKKPLVVDAFVKWRVVDVSKYYTASSGSETRAEQRLAGRMRNGLRNEISRRDMHEVVSGERDRLMSDLTHSLDSEMRNEFGVTVVDVRVKRIDLPPEVSNKVYDRMASEREVLARQYRAEGEEKSLEIRARAEREQIVIRAEAYKQAEILRGEGDARATDIYANSFGANPEFYRFRRSLSAYSRSFKGREDILIVDPSSDFFRYLKAADKK